MQNTKLPPLLGDYTDFGFSLEVNDRTSELFFKNKKIVSFNSTTVPADVIAEVCKNYLASIARWA